MGWLFIEVVEEKNRANLRRKNNLKTIVFRNNGCVHY